jgi:hypothetical protein
MSCRSVPQKISDFLVRRQSRMYCDTCIQERLGLKWRQQVQLITATLAVTDTFKRDLGPCCTCNEVKQVIQAIGSLAAAERVLTLSFAPKLDEEIGASPGDKHQALFRSDRPCSSSLSGLTAQVGPSRLAAPLKRR